MSADKDYFSLPLRSLVDDTVAKSPTPGGGSVAAVVGALASSLGGMVLAFTIGKPKYAEHEAELAALRDDLAGVADDFARLCTDDMRAFEAVMAARKQDAAAQAEANARAIAVPMEIAARAARIVAQLDAVKAKVNPHLLGDLKAAAILAEATARTAACSIRDNLPAISDRGEADQLGRRLAALLDEARRSCEAVSAYQSNS